MPAPPIVKDKNKPEWWLIEADGRTHITSREWGHSLWWAGVARVSSYGNGDIEDLVPFPWSKAQIEAVPRKDVPEGATMSAASADDDDRR